MADPLKQDIVFLARPVAFLGGALGVFEFLHALFRGFIRQFGGNFIPVLALRADERDERGVLVLRPFVGGFLFLYPSAGRLAQLRVEGRFEIIQLLSCHSII